MEHVGSSFREQASQTRRQINRALKKTKAFPVGDGGSLSRKRETACKKVRS